MTIVGDIDTIKRADVDALIAETFYDGKGLKEVFSNPSTAAILGKNAENYKINIAKRGVDGVMDKLVCEGWSLTIDGATSPSAEEAFRENVWKHNKLDQLIPDALEAAEKYGDAYLLTWPVEDEGATEVDIFLHRPIGARMFYDPGNEQVPLRYVRTWLVKGPGSTQDQVSWYRRVNIITAMLVVKLITAIPAAQVRSDDQFVPFTDEDEVRDPADDEASEQLPGVSENPYGVMPVAHLRNRRPYGFPEHECLYGCQNLLLKVIATLGESVDGFGIPWRYRTLSADKMLKPGTDILDQDLDDETAEEAIDRIRTRAGELANLWDTDTVGQLMPGDVGNLLDPIDKVMQLAATVSTTPLDYFDASAASASGESKKEHKGPYLAKVRKRRKDLGSAIVQALEFAMVEILGYVGTVVTLVWEALIERSDAERYEQIGTAVRNGVPWAVACVEAGYDPEEIDEWVANGWAPDDAPAVRAELFKTVASGMQHLAAAQTLGALDQAGALELMRRALERPSKQDA